MVKFSLSISLMVFFGWICPAISIADDDHPADDTTAAAELFQNRIMPIFRSENPSSCVQCHLASVDLKNYILPSHEKTFASLRDQGLIDLDHPEDSKILKLIEMGEKDYDQGAKLIHEQMRKAEQEAFSAWIKACCADQNLRNLPGVEKTEIAKPANPDEVIRHGRKGRVINSFVRNVWSQRMRCFPCHTPHEIKPDQKDALAKFEEWQGNYGDRMVIFKKSPQETIDYLMKQSADVDGDDLPLLNLQQPAKSLLVLKPTSKLPPKNADDEIGQPTYAEPVYHMGGLKMHKDDQSYKSFIAWITDYSKVLGNEYTTASDLPDDNWYATQKVLRVADVPETWPVGTPVQLVVYGRQGDRPEWSQQPIAFTQSTITPRRMVNGPLFLMAPTDSEQRRAWFASKNQLPPGDYLVKVLVDSNNQLADDPTLMLGEESVVGEFEIHNAKWNDGFPKAETVSFK